MRGCHLKDDRDLLQQIAVSATDPTGIFDVRPILGGKFSSRKGRPAGSWAERPNPP